MKRLTVGLFLMAACGPPDSTASATSSASAPASTPVVSAPIVAAPPTATSDPDLSTLDGEAIVRALAWTFGASKPKVVDTRTLLGDYHSNEVRAEATYEGKPLAVSAMVERIEKREHPVVHLNDGPTDPTKVDRRDFERAQAELNRILERLEVARPIEAHLNRNDAMSRHSVMNTSAGDAVVVTCAMVRRQGDTIVLDGCVLIGRDILQTMPSAKPSSR